MNTHVSRSRCRRRGRRWTLILLLHKFIPLPQAIQGEAVPPPPELTIKWHGCNMDTGRNLWLLPTHRPSGWEKQLLYCRMPNCTTIPPVWVEPNLEADCESICVDNPCWVATTQSCVCPTMFSSTDIIQECVFSDLMKLLYCFLLQYFYIYNGCCMKSNTSIWCYFYNQ